MTTALHSPVKKTNRVHCPNWFTVCEKIPALKYCRKKVTKGWSQWKCVKRLGASGKSLCNWQHQYASLLAAKQEILAIYYSPQSHLKVIKNKLLKLHLWDNWNAWMNEKWDAVNATNQAPKPMQVMVFEWIICNNCTYFHCVVLINNNILIVISYY
jgi:hypothetical protein